jgi:hypothetical protein
VSNTSKTNYFHRVYLGWLATEISQGRVPAERQIADMASIDLEQNRDLFDRFLSEESLEDGWRELEAEQGTIAVLTYFNG